MSELTCNDLPSCAEDGRRERLRSAGHLNGIDFVEVGTPQESLCVHMLGNVPETIGIANVRIRGGRRITAINVISVTRDTDPQMHDDPCLRVIVDRTGDHSPYCLCLVTADSPAEPAQWRPLEGFDPRHACATFTFKIDCPQSGDCARDTSCPTVSDAPQEINYLAKDYGSFRQLILDRLALKMPDWRERRAADLNIALVEVLAYTADRLSYYQDAVATESYLGTARRRISVRRHARLVDYRMHEGCNARSLVTIATDTDRTLSFAGMRLIAPPADTKDPRPGFISQLQLDAARERGAIVFEPLDPEGRGEIELVAAHSTIRIYTWGDELCCLPRGSMRATLVDRSPPVESPDGEYAATEGSPTRMTNGNPTRMSEDPACAANESDLDGERALRLVVGDVLIFEEVIGPATGDPDDADPSHRHAVRLTKVEPAVDALYGVPVVEIEWADCDALPFDLCLSVRKASPDCAYVRDVCVARGNVVVVDHGDSGAEESWIVPGRATPGCCSCEGAVVDVTRGASRASHVLSGRGLTFAETLTADVPICRLFERDARRSLPQLVVYGGPGEEIRRDALSLARWRWEARYDLLGSHADDRHFVVEMDDEGRAQLRFGDGTLGAQPQAGDTFRARLRVGHGPAGNVGRDSIVWLALDGESLDGADLRPRNPLAASGGTPPESIADVKLYAPGAFRALPLRAITAADYAMFAERVSAVQRAACAFEWTGCVYEANVAIDPFGNESLSDALATTISDSLHLYRRVGHDLAVSASRYVPLTIALRVCARPDFIAAHVEAELRERFSSGRRRDGSAGFFHPDRWQLGQPLLVSRILAEAQSIEGVSHASVLRLHRQHEPATEEALQDGVLSIDARELVQVANDPDFPERGLIEFEIGGGR